VNTLKQIPDRKLKAAKGAFDASIDCGITFFDTAEVYGAGVRNRKPFFDTAVRFIKVKSNTI
jgi:aryl-alcohol dehydrogenase-like predicted oxidoreductase